jgi:hypothetical protein
LYKKQNFNHLWISYSVVACLAWSPAHGAGINIKEDPNDPRNSIIQSTMKIDQITFIQEKHKREEPWEKMQFSQSKKNDFGLYEYSVPINKEIIRKIRSARFFLNQGEPIHYVHFNTHDIDALKKTSFYNFDIDIDITFEEGCKFRFNNFKCFNNFLKKWNTVQRFTLQPLSAFYWREGKPHLVLNDLFYKKNNDGHFSSRSDVTLDHDPKNNQKKHDKIKHHIDILKKKYHSNIELFKRAEDTSITMPQDIGKWGFNDFVMLEDQNQHGKLCVHFNPLCSTICINKGKRRKNSNQDQVEARCIVSNNKRQQFHIHMSNRLFIHPQYHDGPAEGICNKMINTINKISEKHFSYKTIHGPHKEQNQRQHDAQNVLSKDSLDKDFNEIIQKLKKPTDDNKKDIKKLETLISSKQLSPEQSARALRILVNYGKPYTEKLRKSLSCKSIASNNAILGYVALLHEEGDLKDVESLLKILNNPLDLDVKRSVLIQGRSAVVNTIIDSKNQNLNSEFQLENAKKLFDLLRTSKDVRADIVIAGLIAVINAFRNTNEQSMYLNKLVDLLSKYRTIRDRSYIDKYIQGWTTIINFSQNNPSLVRRAITQHLIPFVASYTEKNLNDREKRMTALITIIKSYGKDFKAEKKQFMEYLFKILHSYGQDTKTDIKKRIQAWTSILNVPLERNIQGQNDSEDVLKRKKDIVSAYALDCKDPLVQANLLITIYKNYYVYTNGLLIGEKFMSMKEFQTNIKEKLDLLKKHPQCQEDEKIKEFYDNFLKNYRSEFVKKRKEKANEKKGLIANLGEVDYHFYKKKLAYRQHVSQDIGYKKQKIAEKEEGEISN